MLSLCLVHFRSLTLAHLAAALHSVRQQDLSPVAEVLVLDNNTGTDARSIFDIVAPLRFPCRVRVLSRPHGDASRTHAWSTNEVVRAAKEPWVLFTRADYLLRFDALAVLWREAQRRGECFATGRVYHLGVDLDACERTDWRAAGPQALRALPGTEERYMAIDSGVWLMPRAAFDAVGGLDERLTAWGHAQTLFQHRLHSHGVPFACLPEVLFYHPRHDAPRDLSLAHAQLRAIGHEPKDLWARYEGRNPY